MKMSSSHGRSPGTSAEVFKQPERAWPKHRRPRHRERCSISSRRLSRTTKSTTAYQLILMTAMVILLLIMKEEFKSQKTAGRTYAALRMTENDIDGIPQLEDPHWPVQEACQEEGHGSRAAGAPWP